MKRDIVSALATIAVVVGWTGWAVVIGNAYTTEGVREQVRLEEAREMCRYLLHEQRSLFDSVRVAEDVPRCWDLLDPSVQPTIRWRSRS